MGDMNEPMLYGALASVEATFAYLGVPYTPGGVTKAIEYLVECRKRGGKA